MVMLTTQTQRRVNFLTSLHMSAGWSPQDAATFWQLRNVDSVMRYPVSEAHKEELGERRLLREETEQSKRDTFQQHRLAEANEESIIDTEEAVDLEFWCRFQSWTYCPKCHKLEPRKLQPGFRRKTPSALNNACKCGNGIYHVPDVDDVPLLLRNLTEEDVRVLRPLEIHCGDY